MSSEETCVDGDIPGFLSIILLFADACVIGEITMPSYPTSVPTKDSHGPTYAVFLGGAALVLIQGTSCATVRLL